MRDANMPLAERINAAIDRITHGSGHMRVPVEATDPDIVLSDCRRALESQAAQIAALTAERDALRADAERYRAAKVNGSHNIAVCEWDGDEWVALDPRMVDSRVDAAIKGQTP